MGIGCHRVKNSSPSIDKYKDIPSSPSSIEIPITETLPDGITLVWLDKTIGQPDSDNENSTLSSLRQIKTIGSIRLYNNVDSCLSFIKSIRYDEKHENSKIFLIVSGELSSNILPELKSYPIINSVFIYCFDYSKYIKLLDEYKPLLIDICTEINDLSNSINKRMDELNQLTLVFHFFSQEQNTTRNLTKDSASFLWFQLFEMILSQLKCVQNDMNIMLDYCSKQISLEKGPKQKQLLKQIEDFRLSYKSENAIYWYTTESFVYHLLNRALRTEDNDALYIFRYFIADLCRQLKIEHKKFQKKQNYFSKLKVYRGGRISSEHLEYLKNTIHNLTSLNGFISTSMKESIALEFMHQQGSKIENNVKVLFLIEVDLQSEYTICAHIADISAQKDEDEVLFNIGTTFYVDDVTFDDQQQIWKVYMRTTEDGNKAARDYIDLIRQELTDTSVSIIFGQLFLQMGNYLSAQKYFSDLLKHISEDDSDYPNISYHLALTDGYQGNLGKAEDRLKKVFYYYQLQKSNQLDLARTKNALGWIFHNSGELDIASNYYREALSYANKQIELNHLINAQTYSLLGDCYLEQFKLDKSEQCYENALVIENLRLPSDHPRIGKTYNDIGNVYRKRQDMNKALEYYEKAELIFSKSLPMYHPYTAYCWSCMAFVYLYYGNIGKSQQSHKKALEIYRRVLPSDHLNIEISEKNAKCTDFRKIIDTYIKVCSQV